MQEIATNDNLPEALSPEVKRLLYSVCGIALAAYGIEKKGILGIAYGGLGAHFLKRSFGFGRREQPESDAAKSRAAGTPAKAVGKSTITAKGTPEDVYAFWRKVSNAPRFMSFVADVREMSPNVSLWRFKYADRPALEVVSEITQDTPGKLIGWNLVGSPLVRGEGIVRFAPAGINGYTEVRLEQWITPAIPVLRGISSMLLNRHVAQNLRNFKQLFETGELATTNGQPSGPRSALVEAAHKIMAPLNPEPVREKSVSATA